VLQEKLICLKILICFYLVLNRRFLNNITKLEVKDSFCICLPPQQWIAMIEKFFRNSLLLQNVPIFRNSNMRFNIIKIYAERTCHSVEHWNNIRTTKVELEQFMAASI